MPIKEQELRAVLNDIHDLAVNTLSKKEDDETVSVGLIDIIHMARYAEMNSWHMKDEESHLAKLRKESNEAEDY